MNTKGVLLFVDDDKSDRRSWRDSLVAEGYTVILASTPEEALSLMHEQAIDLAIIDLKLRNDPDDKTGITLAREESIRHIPKIILTGHAVSNESWREATGFARGELPSVMTIVGKEEGPGPLLKAIEDSLITWHQLRQSTIKAAAQIQHDNAVARQHANLLDRIALVAAVVGFIVIIISIGLVLINEATIAVASMVSGVLLEALVLLFYSRLDYANQRVDLYHRELMQLYGLEILLSASEHLPGETEVSTKAAVIMSAANRWFTTSQITNTEE